MIAMQWRSWWCAGALLGFAGRQSDDGAVDFDGAAVRLIAPAAAAQPVRCAGAHSVAPRPVGDAWIWRADASGCTFRLPPARSNKMDAKWRPTDGSGVAVAGATLAQPFCNHHDIDAKQFSYAVAELHPMASRHVRVCRRAGARAYGAFKNSATLQPSIIIQCIEWFSGCKMVAPRLQLQPVAMRRGMAGSRGAGRNILGTGYSCAPERGLIRGTIEGLRGETFDLGAGDRAVLGGIDGCAGVIGRNGGNQPFWAVVDRLVGRLMLEWMVQGLAGYGFSDACHKLCSLVHRSAGRWGQHGRGVNLASATRPSPIAATRSAACGHSHFSEFGSGIRPLTSFRRGVVAGGRQTSSGQMGSGVWERAKLGMAAAGRGAGARVFAGWMGTVESGARYVQ